MSIAFWNGVLPLWKPDFREPSFCNCGGSCCRLGVSRLYGGSCSWACGFIALMPVSSKRIIGHELVSLKVASLTATIVASHRAKEVMSGLSL